MTQAAAPAKLERAYIPHDLFKDFFANNGLFAEQIVALQINPAVQDVNVTFSRSLPKAETVGEIHDSDQSFELVSFIPLGSFTLVETTKPIPRPTELYSKVDSVLAAVWETMPQITTLNKKRDFPFYLAGSSRAQLNCQYYLLSNGVACRFYPIYEQQPVPGVTSIRYDKNNGRLVGIKVNERGLGACIAQFPIQVAIRKPHRLDQVDYWRVIDDRPNQPPILHSFSRPNTQGQLALNYQTGMVETIHFPDRNGPPQRSQTVPSRARVVGAMTTGIDTYLEYEPLQGHTKIRTIKMGPQTPQPLCELAK